MTPMPTPLHRILRLTLLTAWISACSAAGPAPATPTAPLPAATSSLPGAPARLKIGIVVFLSGSAAEPFGLPARQGAEVILENINAGRAPAPYDRPGVAGVPLAAVYVDEAGGAEHQVAELQRLYAEAQVDLVIGYISSGDCLAAAPAAEQLQRLLVAFDCGTSRLFEERDYRYVFRTNAHQAIDSLAGARYLLQMRPGLQTIAGINQNYSWGQDSWAHFRDTLLQLKPGVRVVSEQFPKLGAEDYSAEIEALLQAGPEVIHTSFWGGDLTRFVGQAGQAGLLERSALLLSVGEYALPALNGALPPGALVGAHGPHGRMAPPGPLNEWLVQIYQQRFGVRPTYPVYHMAQAILGVKLAYENAAGQAGRWPVLDEVIQAFEYLEYPTPSGPIALSIGHGHQAVEPAVYALAGPLEPAAAEVALGSLVTYPADCVNPPEGVTTEEWIRSAFPGADCP